MAGFISLDHPFFISDRPEDNRWVVAVTEDQLFELAHVFGNAAHQPVLIEHQHPQPVTGIQQFAGRRIMAGAICIATHFLKLLYPVILKAVGES